MKKYNSLNDPNGFYYHDAELLSVSTTENNMIWTADWIAVTSQNSLSVYDCDMRTKDIVITFENYKIERTKKYSYEVGASSGKILEQFPEIELNENEMAEFLNEIKNFKGWCANFVSASGKTIGNRVIFEANLDFECNPYSFVYLEISCDKLIVEWDEYSDKQQD